MQQLEWFGLKARNGVMNMSIVSPYPRALSENEFIKEPMNFAEKDEVSKTILISEYRRFFTENLLSTEEVRYKNEHYYTKAIGDVELLMMEFFEFGESRSFSDKKSSVIFVLEPYVEIIVYSEKRFHLKGYDGLFLRMDNVECLWSDTYWA